MQIETKKDKDNTTAKINVKLLNEQKNKFLSKKYI